MNRGVINRILLRRNRVCLRLGALYNSDRGQHTVRASKKRSGPENPDLFGASYEGHSPWKYISFVEKDEGAWTVGATKERDPRLATKPYHPQAVQALGSRSLLSSFFSFSFSAPHNINLSPVRLVVRP